MLYRQVDCCAERTWWSIEHNWSGCLGHSGRSHTFLQELLKQVYEDLQKNSKLYVPAEKPADAPASKASASKSKSADDDWDWEETTPTGRSADVKTMLQVVRGIRSPAEQASHVELLVFLEQRLILVLWLMCKCDGGLRAGSTPARSSKLGVAKVKGNSAD
eukprot:449815-Hanusia_phi.AAC.1